MLQNIPWVHLSL